MSPYEEGQKARRDGKRFEANPYLGEFSKAGIQRSKVGFESAASEWNKGMRDQNDGFARQSPRLPKRKANRYYGGC